MKINSISTSGIYAKNAVAMKSRKTDNATIRDFKNFMKNKNLVLKATLTPTDKGFYTELELSKKQGYSLNHVTDENGYGVNSTGRTINEAVLDMAKKYNGQNLFISEGGFDCFQVPKCP